MKPACRMHDRVNLWALPLIGCLAIAGIFNIYDPTKVTNAFLMYIVADFVWVWVEPDAVPSKANVILVHHFITFLLLLFPLRYPSFALYTCLDGVTEINTFFLIARRQWKSQQQGPLEGLAFAAKDIYDVKGYRTAFGNPTWLETHPVATSTAPAVQALLDAGARLVGKTHMDELAYSLNGENVHYGTPVNPAAPDRVPGGSSSGSAVAVADGTVDIGLGSDTGGSVRVPAAYCGILGIRPTHGRVSLEIACPMAPSFDTGGFFARQPDVLRKAADVLLATTSAKPSSAKLTRWLVAKDAFDQCSAATSQAIFQAVQTALPSLNALVGSPSEITVASLEGHGQLFDWYHTFRICQGGEVWACHGEWVQTAKPKLGPEIKKRFLMASRLTADEVATAKAARTRITAHVEALLGPDGFLMLPTIPGPAPKRGLSGAEQQTYREKLMCLTCIAGLSGLPQVTLPIARVDGCPVALSLLGPRNSDEQLLGLAEQLLPLLTSG
ncbi:hypothetical protein WJX72_004102 [[Myrmecia] bisecta]|uniref:Amidase domain-containing protein n=1 Tax=[Myrmecia] bisecta TaxID=41462 RepID=A0AAW1R5X5_9CHLO